MKLYNIYKNLILESAKDKILQAINDKISVRIWYRDSNNNLEERYVFIYGLGKTKAGNEAIRAFQAFGGTQTNNSKWKTFRVDRISRIELTNFKFYKPVNKVKGGENIPKYVGPSDKSMLNGKLDNYVIFDYKIK